jgi:phosphatidylinositol dimannoside acyltransferase
MSRFVPRLRLWKYYTMLFVVHTIGRLPLRFRYGVAVVVANRVYALRRSIREALRSNIRHVLGPDASDEEVDLVARECARNAGRNYADIVGMHRMDVRKFYQRNLVLEGIDYVKEAQASGRGVVLASAHYANPEFATQGLTQAGIEVFALVEPLQPPQLHELMYRLRNRHGHHYEAANFKGVKSAIDWLRRGGVLAILIDRDIQKRGIELEFCGAKARFPTGAVDLATRTNSVLIPGWVRREGGYKIRARIGPPLDLIVTANRDDDLRVNTARLLALFERELKADPKQWTVLEKVWKD